MKYIQKTYEDKTRGMMVHDFIKANHPYIPLDYESVFQYINNKKEAYFENLEFNNSILQASGFLTDKLANYVFTAIPLDATTKNEAENAQIENVDTVSARILDLDAKYKVHLYYTLWAQAAASGHDHTSDYIYDSYLKKLLSIGENQEIGQQIEEHNRLRLGATAPNIEWDEDEIRSDLRNIDGADKYLLVFWSSTCSHCLRELPALHKELKNNENVQVIAIGLEDDSYSWEDESSRMPDFIHVIALGKWESEYAELYAIDQTPTYFILDKDKKIRAKPEDDKAVVELLENY
jgi:thioredoxin-related protein